MCIVLLLFMEHWFNFIISAIIKSHNRNQANILYKETDRKELHQRNLIIFITLRNGVTRDICTDNSAIFFLCTTFTPQIKRVYNQCIYHIMHWLWNFNKMYIYARLTAYILLTNPKSPNNYQIPLMKPFVVHFFI